MPHILKKEKKNPKTFVLRLQQMLATVAKCQQIEIILTHRKHMAWLSIEYLMKNVMFWIQNAGERLQK